MILTSKIIQIISIWIVSFSLFIGMAVWLFGSMFNDTGDAQWQKSLNVAALWTFAIFIVVIIIFACSNFFNWSDKIKVLLAIVSIVGAIGTLFTATSPFIRMLLMSRQVKNTIIAEETKKNADLVQTYLKRNRVLNQEEIKQFFDKQQTSSQREVDEIDRAYVLGWQQLLDAKLINPNMIIDAKPLLQWVMSQRADFARALLEHGADPNAADGAEGNTALLNLARQRFISIGSLPKDDYFTKFNLLVSCGADINYKNKEGATALDYANQNHDYLTGQVKKGVSVYDKKDLEIIDELIGKIKSTIDNPPVLQSCSK
jgi:hypothetical protein